MASSNIPSPTPSSSSSHLPHSFSVMQPPRAPSASSAMSSGSRDKPYGYSNGYPPDLGEDYDPGLQHQTPQPPNMPHPGYANANPSAFLPQLSSSPPPHPPQYVPPPQHAMAPDPIHSIPLGMLPPPGVGGPGVPMMQGGWPNGPYGRGPPAGYKLPNGMGLPNSLDGYPMRMGGTPGPLPPIGSSILQQAILGNGHRPNSAHGEGRERRRRDRDDDGEEEVISTIFVVGFPDDMQEREFQNIFTFSPGFEAATLKFPSGSNRPREPTAALLAELQQLAANQQAAAAAAAEHGEPPIPMTPLEDALAALQMNTASTSSSTTPSAAISMTPSAPSGPMLGSGGLPTRRQTIGFARFKTRADAIAAKEHLQGRKIDTLTGATLKAEMAKKNLHTKRATSGEELVGLLLRSGRLAGLMNMTGGAGAGGAGGGGGPGGVAGGPGVGGMGGGMSGLHPLHPHTTGLSAGAPPQQSAKEAWDSWAPAGAGAGAPGDGRERDMSRDRSATVGSMAASQSGTNYGGDDRGVEREREKLPQLGGGGRDNGAPPGLNNNNNGYYATGSTLPSSVSSNSTTNPLPPGAGDSPPLSLKSPSARPTDSKALLALAEEADELEGWSVSGLSTGNFGMDYRGGGSGGPGGAARANSMSGQRPAPYGMGTMGYAGMYGSSPTGNSASLGGGVGGGGGGGPGSDHMSDTGRSMGAMSAGGNPADQNPPINTLYVGNLPAISPPTHPPNFLEESLRALFSSMPGFKRMSFRQKINGPMCFVEFEDVGYASLGIKELYGHTLGGLVKGGIRLSYSKNSLGQRGNSHLGSSNPMFGGIAHTVALAGMSAPIGSGPGTNGGSGGGGPQKSPYPSSVSLDRRGSESTALSPTAQPFNATSPRSRYFSSVSGVSGGGTPPIGIPKDPSPPIPGNHPFPSSTGSGSVSGGGGGSGGFSPTVSSPIRTPASFSWVSSGNGGYGHMGMSPPLTAGGIGNSGGSGGGFEGFHGGSLNGAANAWGQSQGL